MKAQKSAATFVKYLIWTAVAAAISYATEHLTDLNLPMYYVPVLAALLKSIATYVATQTETD